MNPFDAEVLKIRAQLRAIGFLREIDAELNAAPDVGVVQQMERWVFPGRYGGEGVGFHRLFHVSLNREVPVEAAAISSARVPIRVIACKETSGTGNQFFELTYTMLPAWEGILVVFVSPVAGPRCPFLVVTAHLELMWPDPD